MGRPIKASYFGTPKGTGMGGESITSVTVGGTNNNYTAFPTLAIDAPATPGGVTALATATAGVVTITLSTPDTSANYAAADTVTITGGTGTAAVVTVDTVDANGAILTYTLTSAGDYTALPTLLDLPSTTSGAGTGALWDISALKINTVTVTEQGTGYQSVPTVTDTPDGNATLTAVLSTGTGNAIAVTAWIPAADGGSSAVAGDIVKQVGARRYKVTTAQGTGRCNLVAAVPAVGEMNIIASDSDGGQYYVSKLESRTACLVPTTGLQFAANSHVTWTFDAATLNTTVTITNV